MIETIHYIYDNAGHKTAVIVPIDLWERVRLPSDCQSKCDISRFYGIYRNYISNPDELAKKLRDEWDRE